MKNVKRDNAIARFLYLIVGAVCGIFMIFSADPEKLFGTPREFALQMIFCMIIIFAAYFIQAIIHELGHLVFGLLTGYKFISFRIGNVMFIKERGKLRTKLYNVVGTGGQCLMMPPPWKENLPTVLYNFGGCILNFITSAVFLIIFIFSILKSKITNYSLTPPIVRFPIITLRNAIKRIKMGVAVIIQQAIRIGVEDKPSSLDILK